MWRLLFPPRAVAVACVVVVFVFAGVRTGGIWALEAVDVAILVVDDGRTVALQRGVGGRDGQLIYLRASGHDKIQMRLMGLRA